MNYDEAVQYLYNIPKFVGKTTAENTLAILKLLGNPEKNMKFFHVAGSNGKGSVCAFINSILVNAGYHTGLFTSPHLVKANERIKIDNMQIDDEEFLDVFNEVYNTVTENEKNGIIHPSFFEFIFLMALKAFAKRDVKYVVLEVGLGGRLDATNVIESPVVSVITSVSLEHTEILGDTIEKIASEKAGIIKKGVPVVYEATDDRVSDVIMKVSDAKNSHTYPVAEKNIKIIKKADKYIDFSLDTSYYDNDMLKIPFNAPYQTVNASLACMAIDVARKNDKDFCDITDENIHTGLKNAVWEGRMECVNENVYIDGAHNVSGMEKFVEAVNTIDIKGKRYLLFGVVKEKDYRHMIDILVKNVVWEKIYITGIQTERAADIRRIEDVFSEMGADSVTCVTNSSDAYDMAVENLKSEDVLFCAGSLYLAGEIKRHIRKED